MGADRRGLLPAEKKGEKKPEGIGGDKGVSRREKGVAFAEGRDLHGGEKRGRGGSKRVGGKNGEVLNMVSSEGSLSRWRGNLGKGGEGTGGGKRSTN